MPKVHLDATFVLTATCPEGRGKIDYYDDTIPNFILECAANGRKTYAVRYRDKFGKQRQYKIGNHPDLTFDKAKREAIKVKSRVSVGENPAEERHVTRRIPTIAELAERYLDYVRTYKRSHDIDERYLRNHVLPRYGKLHINELDQTDILDWLDRKVKVDGYAQATVNRWQVILCHMLKMAKKWGLPGSDNNPLAGVPQKPCDNQIERFLTAEETTRLLAAVDASPNPQLGAITRLLLLTGCRKRELLDATWDEFQLDRQIWRIPTHRAKTNKVRHVQLSDAAIEVLNALPRWDDCPYVIPNPDTLLPYTSVFTTWDKARKAAGLPDVRMHDLRHSHASWLVEAGYSLYVVSKALGHTSSRTTERYAHVSDTTLRGASNAAAQMIGSGFGNRGKEVEVTL